MCFSLLVDFPASIFLPLHLTPYTLHLILRADWAHGLPGVAVVADPIHVAGTDVHAPRAVRVVRAERTQPVSAGAACEVERTVDAGARSGEENTIAVRLARYLVTHYTVLGSP